MTALAGNTLRKLIEFMSVTLECMFEAFLSTCQQQQDDPLDVISLMGIEK